MSTSRVGAPQIVVIARNNLHLLRSAIDSFLMQADTTGVKLDARVLVVDNGSHDATSAWLHTRPDLSSIFIYPQHGVAHAWNTALRWLFDRCGEDRVLVCNQDVVLRPDTWYWLASEQADFVTAVGRDDPGCLLTLMIEGKSIESSIGTIRVHHPTRQYAEPRADAKRPHPDFSCFMISRRCWDVVGPFDENFRGAFCEDADYHARLHQAGIAAYSIDLPFWHVGGGSQTIKLASASEREAIQQRAAANRTYFARKWGFEVPSEKNGGVEYYRYFGHEAPS